MIGRRGRTLVYVSCWVESVVHSWSHRRHHIPGLMRLLILNHRWNQNHRLRHRHVVVAVVEAVVVDTRVEDVAVVGIAGSGDFWVGRCHQDWHI